MKMVWIIYNIGIDDDIIDMLENLDIKFYTKFPECVGVGKVTGARLNNHVWPGANHTLMVILPETQATHLMDVLQRLRDTIGKHEGLYAFETDVLRVTE